MVRRVLTASMLIAALLVAAASVAQAHEPGGGPEHGVGGNSSHCSDGVDPPGGQEVGVKDVGDAITTGAQFGSNSDHILYADLCLRFFRHVEVPFCCEFNVQYGSYSSTRFHLNLSDCPPDGHQVIHNNDSGNSIDVAPNTNNCP